MHICSLCFPPLFFPLLFSFFPLSNGDKCDLRETRHSVRGGGKKQRKKCVRTFRKDAFRNEKCEKQKQRAGNKTKPAVGRRAVTKKKKKRTTESERTLGFTRRWRRRRRIVHPRRYRPILSLVVLCHHSSRLTICPRIRFYLSPDLSSIVFQTVLFQASDPLSSSRHRCPRTAPLFHRPPKSHR